MRPWSGIVTKGAVLREKGIGSVDGVVSAGPTGWEIIEMVNQEAARIQSSV